MMTTKYYQQSVEEVIRQLRTDLTQGLSSTDVAALQERDGLNEFAKKQHTSLWQKFIAQFKSFMIIVLLVAAVISGVTGYMNGDFITRCSPLRITLQWGADSFSRESSAFSALAS